MLIPKDLRVNPLVIAKYESKCINYRKGYKFAMWSYYIDKLLAVKELTGYISPELKEWFAFVRFSQKGVSLTELS